MMPAWTRCFSLWVLLFVLGCQKEDPAAPGHLAGAWVDKESMALQFIDFQSDTKGRFGLYARNLERYEPFAYRLFGDKIGIRFLPDHPETIHTLAVIDEETMTISDLTDIPENPVKTYVRRDIITDRVGDTIVLGPGQLYYDFEQDFRLEVISVTDSRCPRDVVCVWQGVAVVQVELVVGGNTRHEFELATLDWGSFARSVSIDGVRYELVSVAPYPESHQDESPTPWQVRLLVHNEG